MKITESTGIQRMFMTWTQCRTTKSHIKIANKSSERAAKFKYLVTTLTYQSSMHKDIMNRLK